MNCRIELEKDKCCGCGTCELVCPKGAIRMVTDECGFVYPQIDDSLCVDCGLCKKKCAFQSGYDTRKEFEPFLGFGARHKDVDTMMNSRSGGAFVALSDTILDSSGIIYGVGYSDDEGFYKVVHKKAYDKESRNEFCGSKYVQSDLTGIFEDIKCQLENGKKVLFSGTGCQVGALYKYLPKEYDNLYTIDIVCHGTPSPKVWKEFLQMREKELHGKVTKVDFRNKGKFGWQKHKETIWINKRPYSSKIYSTLFKLGISRPACYECVYANKNRVGDITIADFWGHENALKELWDDDKGISLVLVNNKKGKEWWEESKKDLDWVDCTGYPFRHSNMKHPTIKSEQYDEFWDDYINHGFEYCVEKYTRHKVEKWYILKIKTYYNKIKRKIKKIIKRCIYGNET